LVQGPGGSQRGFGVGTAAMPKRRSSSSSEDDDRPAPSCSGSSSSDGNENDDSPLPDRSEAAAALMRWAKAGNKEKSPDDEEEKSSEDEAEKSPEDEAEKSPEDEVEKSPEDEAEKSPEDEVEKSPEDEAVPSRSSDSSEEPARKAGKGKGAKPSTRESSDDTDRRETKSKASKPSRRGNSDDTDRSEVKSKTAKASRRESSDDMDTRQARNKVAKRLRRGSSADMDRRVMNARAASEASDASEISELQPPQDDKKRSRNSEVDVRPNQSGAAASLSAAAEAMQEAEASRADEAQVPPLEVEAENLKEMLAERQAQLAQEESGPKREEIEKDVAILTGWLRSKERELVERDKMQLKERLKGFELEAKKLQEQQEAAKQAEAGKQVAAEPPAAPRNGTATASTPAAAQAVDVVTVPPVGGRVPPCDLPLWCVIPNPDDIVTHVEILRQAKSDNSSTKRLSLGRRSWVLLGRRQQPPVSGPEPDIGLASPRASRSHALVLRNWQGQIFLLDLGSPNGSFLGDKKLPAKRPCEWKVGVTAYFADASREVFELRQAA